MDWGRRARGVAVRFAVTTSSDRWKVSAGSCAAPGVGEMAGASTEASTGRVERSTLLRVGMRHEVMSGLRRGGKRRSPRGSGWIGRGSFPPPSEGLARTCGRVEPPPPSLEGVRAGSNGAGLLAWRHPPDRLPGTALGSSGRGQGWRGSAPSASLTVAGPRRFFTGLPGGLVRELLVCGGNMTRGGVGAQGAGAYPPLRTRIRHSSRIRSWYSGATSGRA